MCGQSRKGKKKLISLSTHAKVENVILCIFSEEEKQNRQWKKSMQRAIGREETPHLDTHAEPEDQEGRGRRFLAGHSYVWSTHC